MPSLVIFRVEKIACDITNDINKNSNPPSEGIATLCVLKGGYKFFSDLLDEIKRINRMQKESIPLSIDFIRLKSYVVSCVILFSCAFISSRRHTKSFKIRFLFFTFDIVIFFIMLGRYIFNDSINIYIISKYSVVPNF